MNDFERRLKEAGYPLRKSAIDIFQVNVGKLCNQTCVHCHVDAGPNRPESMTFPTAEAILRAVHRLKPDTLDITGGAPELNPHFNYLVSESRKAALRVIDRCNLTVFFEPGMDYLPEFLAGNQVAVVASLPCYSAENVEKQRGKGVFRKSIDALLILNELGYGAPGSGLELNLVYNPVEPDLPPPQEELEADYRARLSEDFGIRFNRLYTITNMPISRFAAYLRSTRQYQAYMCLLIANFNPGTLDGLMCRNTLSIGWDGRLFDCDFNQMLNMSFKNDSGSRELSIFDEAIDAVLGREVDTGSHCFGCTAGAGSSCAGALK